MSSYPLCFGSSWYPTSIRFNANLDTIFFGHSFWKFCPLFFSLLSVRELQDIRYLAFDYDDFADSKDIAWRTEEPKFLKKLKLLVEGMEGLQELLVIRRIEKCIDPTYYDGYSPGFWKNRDWETFHGDSVKLYDNLDLPKMFTEARSPFEVPTLTSKWKVKKHKMVVGWWRNMEFHFFNGDEPLTIESDGCKC